MLIYFNIKAIDVVGSKYSFEKINNYQAKDTQEFTIQYYHHGFHAV